VRPITVPLCRLPTNLLRRTRPQLKPEPGKRRRASVHATDFQCGRYTLSLLKVRCQIPPLPLQDAITLLAFRNCHAGRLLFALLSTLQAFGGA